MGFSSLFRVLMEESKYYFFLFSEEKWYYINSFASYNSFNIFFFYICIYILLYDCELCFRLECSVSREFLS